MKKKFSLKDHLFNKDKIHYLALQLQAVDSDFDAKAFESDIMKDLHKLELKERIGLITKMLHVYLPKDYEQAVSIIVKSLPEELDPSKEDNDFGNFIFAPYTYYIAYYGCKKKYLSVSYKALHAITIRFSAEDAIRYFLNDFEKRTLEVLSVWAKDTNYHVRRLASEGTRPKLPWSTKLHMDYKKALPLLDKLYSDKTRYVTRSVANHLNDISKIDPDLVVSTLAKWTKSNKQTAKEMDYIKGHSLRTLVKKGNVNALTLLGYSQKPNIVVSNFSINTSTIQLGDSLEFSCIISARADEKLLVDYKIGFKKANGDNKDKVFKLKSLSVKKDQNISITKKHPMKKDISTFRIYPGKQTLTLQINGVETKRISFEIVS